MTHSISPEGGHEAHEEKEEHEEKKEKERTEVEKRLVAEVFRIYFPCPLCPSSSS